MLKKTNWKVIGAAVAAVLVGGIALAQQEVLMTGQDSTGTTRAVRTDSNGNIITSGSSSTPTGAASGTHGACTNTTMNVGTTGTACPAVPMVNRTSLMIQLNQTGQNLRVTANGQAATATLGINVPSGNSYNDNLAGTVNASCRCDAATCEVSIVECP